MQLTKLCDTLSNRKRQICIRDRVLIRTGTNICACKNAIRLLRFISNLCNLSNLTTMSSQKAKTELTTYGYTKKHYGNAIPMVINKLIESFYDKYFYWKIQKEAFRQFLNAKNGDIIYSKKTFKIKGIQFECTLCPNGWRRSHKGVVVYYIETKNIPQDIEYFTASLEIGCDSFNMRGTHYTKWKVKGDGWGLNICKLSKCANFNHINFYCAVDILGIKYKKTSDKDDYKMDIKMNKHNEFEWIIDDKSKLQQFGEDKSLRCLFKSNCFGDNNWDVVIKRSILDESLSIVIECVRCPFDINSMDVECYLKLEWDSDEAKQERWQGTLQNNRWIVIFRNFNFIALLNAKWIKLNVVIDILNIRNEKNKVIDENKWIEYIWFD